MNRPHSFILITALSIASLALLCVAWELYLAPLRPGGSWMALKALPLLVAVKPLWRGHHRTYQWWSMLILLYVCEGLMRGMTDSHLSQILGWLEASLATLAYVSILGFCRARRRAGLPH